MKRPLDYAYMMCWIDYTHIYYARCEGPDAAVYAWYKAMKATGYTLIGGTI